MEAVHEVAATDEGRHEPTTEQLFNESVYLDVVDESGKVGGYVRLGLYPNLGVIWWTAAVTIAGRGPIVAARYDLAAPVAGFNIDSNDVKVTYEVERELEVVTVSATSPAKEFASPEAAYDEALGTPVDLAMELTWTTAGVPYHYAVTTRYEIPCTVKGSLTIDGEVFSVAGPGQRDHSWGVRDWWSFGWCWSALHFDDGRKLHLADIRLDGVPPLGYLQRDGEVHTLEVATTSEVTNDEGIASSAHFIIEPGGFTVHVTPTGFGPLLLVSDDGKVDRFPRAMVEATTSEGVRGRGWIEWNQPQH
jgi:hypothetical protein